MEIPTVKQLIDLLWQQFENNQFLAGGFLLGTLGCIAAYLRNTPSRIWHWCKRRAFIDFEIPMTDEAFFWFNDWLAKQPYTHKRARYLTVRTTSRCKSGDAPNPSSPQALSYGEPDSQHPCMPDIVLSPAPGRHIMWFKRHLLIVDRERKEVESGSSGLVDSSHFAREKYDVSVMSWNRNVIKDILCEARKAYYPPGERRVRVCSHSHDSWRHSSRRPRSMNSVIWPDDKLDNLVQDCSRFLTSEQWYTDLGIPYRRGYLLHGPPGNGKSSGVIALASHLNMSIYIVNLGEQYLSDSVLQRLMGDVDARSIVLMEDVDCAFADRESDGKDNRLTFSGVLNAIDGVAASEGRLLFMTTNHKERLDPALIRPGRCDVQIEIGNARPSQASQMFLRFFPDDTEGAKRFAQLVSHETCSMAKVQGHLLRHRDSASEALTTFDTQTSAA